MTVELLRRVLLWQARCDCGWHGDPKVRRRTAEHQGRRHAGRRRAIPCPYR